MNIRLEIYKKQLENENCHFEIINRNIDIINQYLYSKLLPSDFLESRKTGYGKNFDNSSIVQSVINDFIGRNING